MAAATITPTRKRKPLKVHYGEDTFILPARVPVEMITASDSVPRPKVMAGSQKDEYQRQVGVAVIAAFVENVLPDDFRAVIDIEDIPAVLEAWAEVSGWGKSSNSATSGGATKARSSSKSVEAGSD